MPARSHRSKNSSTVFVGTYTKPEESDSEGVYLYRMDSFSGKLTFHRVQKGIENPSFLAIHPQLDFLYAVNEVQEFAGQAGGGLSAFSIDPSTDALTPLNHQFSHGKDPCYICIERTGRFALIANYTSGSVAMFPIQADGRVSPASEVIQHRGSSANPQRQEGPHAHCILPDPTNRFALVADLGLDKILIYRMDLERGKLLKHSEVDVRPGAGPRHLTFHPNGQYAYLINELNASLTCYRYDADVGILQELQTVSVLAEDFQGENLSAEVRVSPDGNYLYASNRGHDSIVCFLIDKRTGRLTYRSYTPGGGRTPRNFAINPSGTFLRVANQKTDNVVTFRIDSASGRLSKTEHEVQVSMPVCVRFAE